jgi:hypothetical protein
VTRRNLHALATLLLLLALPGTVLAEPAGEQREEPDSLLRLEARRLGGGTESLDRYRGQVLLVVNTASRCGYTPQYEGLQALYDRYRSQGFRSPEATRRSVRSAGRTTASSSRCSPRCA